MKIQDSPTDRKIEIKNLSHDLRTPLTSVLGFSELLLEDTSIQGESREYLDIVVNESRRLADLITKFIDQIAESNDPGYFSYPAIAGLPEQQILDLG